MQAGVLSLKHRDTSKTIVCSAKALGVWNTGCVAELPGGLRESRYPYNVPGSFHVFLHVLQFVARACRGRPYPRMRHFSQASRRGESWFRGGMLSWFCFGLFFVCFYCIFFGFPVGESPLGKIYIIYFYSFPITCAHPSYAENEWFLTGGFGPV